MTTVDVDTNDGQREPWVRIATIAAVVLAVVVAAAFVVVGRLNADEGWYLYAGRLAWRGELPYADFAFTQTPLLPYLYGGVQALASSLVLGRAFSVLLASAGIVLSVRVAWRLAGDRAAMIVAVLCAAYPVGLYNLALSKTYALVLLCFAGAAALLTSNVAPRRAWPLACAVAWAATFARASSIPLTVAVVVFCCWTATDRHTRMRVLAVAAAGAAVMAAFLLVDPSNARFDLVTMHALRWEDASLGTRLETVLTERIPDWIGDYPVYVALAVGTLVSVLTVARARAFVGRTPAIAVVGVGVVGYLAVQLWAGQFAPVEYAAPMVPVLLALCVPVLLVALGLGCREHTDRRRPLVAYAVLAAAAVVTIFHPAPWEYIVRPTSAGGLAHQGDVADVVRDLTDDDDEVLAMWAQPIVLDAGRDFVPGVTLGPFSYADLSTARARELHYVNAAMLRDIFVSERPAVVVFTDVDRFVLSFRGAFSTERADPAVVLDALRAHYRRVHTSTTWGVDEPVQLEVYVRKGSAAAD
jgi:hypothetical protein